MTMHVDQAIYQKQGFGRALQPEVPAALLMIDFTVAFVDPDHLGGGNIGTAAQMSEKLLAYARAATWPIAHTRMVFADDGSDANIFCRKIPGNLKMTDRAEISQIIAPLAPKPGELVIGKNLPSAFFGTTLGAWLASRGVRTVVIAGATTSGCIRASVVDAMSFGFIPIVVTDCVGDRSVQQHDSNLFDMQQKYAELTTFEGIRSLQLA
jgi:maleamate amidohydrolase